METCRFCLEEAYPTNLVDPCQCRGSVRYVHPECLDRELITRSRSGMATQNCRICGTAYILATPIPVLAMSHIVLPMTIVSVCIAVTNPIIMTILCMTAVMNWTLCFFWKLTPIVFILRTKSIQCLLAIGLLLPVAHLIPNISILLSFAIPYVTFLLWVTDDPSPHRILFGFFGLVEFCLLMTSFVVQTVSFNVCLLLALLSVLPISSLMITG
jgi:hypothetical protein